MMMMIIIVIIIDDDDDHYYYYCCEYDCDDYDHCQYLCYCHYQLCIIATTTIATSATKVVRDGGTGETCKMERTDIV